MLLSIVMTIFSRPLSGLGSRCGILSAFSEWSLQWELSISWEKKKKKKHFCFRNISINRQIKVVLGGFVHLIEQTYFFPFFSPFILIKALGDCKLSFHICWNRYQWATDWCGPGSRAQRQLLIEEFPVWLCLCSGTNHCQQNQQGFLHKVKNLFHLFSFKCTIWCHVLTTIVMLCN